MTAEIFKVIAKFTRADGSPLSGPEYSITLKDQDRLFDDKLGESALNEEGEASFLVFTADIFSIDSPEERTPDIYFIVKRDGSEIFRTDVFPNVSFDSKDDVTGRPDSTTQAFGPFEVPQD